MGVSSGEKTAHFAGSGCFHDNHHFWLFFFSSFLSTYCFVNLLQSGSFSPSHAILPIFYLFLFQTGCLSFSVLVHWVMWLAVFSVEAQSLVIGWLHSRSTLCIYVGNTNRCTDEQMVIDRDREIFYYLLRLHAVHSTHLFPHSQCMFLETLNCCKLFISGTNVTLSFDCTLAGSSGSAGGLPFRAFNILD